MLIRFAGEAQWTLTTTDIKTAFLNAPIVTPNEEIIIVRVPALLRAANVCQEKYWRVRRALYGLDVAPRSWTLHRNQTLKSIAQLVDGRQVTCSQLDQDANIWEIRDAATGRIISWIGVYVDDILLVAAEEYRQSVTDTLCSLWNTSEPEVVSEDKYISFAGYEIRKVGFDYHVHQKSYIREMLSQWEIDEEFPTPCVKEPPRRTDRELDVFELTKRAQSIAGQLLWISTHTRPDVCYSVQNVCHLISSDPASACDAGIVVMQYLKYSLNCVLQYGKASRDYGIWNELQFRRDPGTIEVFTDASFCPDEGCKSFQCAMLFWGEEW